MLRALGGCVRRILVLAFALGAVALAWQHRDTLVAAWRALRDPSGPRLPSVEVAAAAEAKLAELVAADPPGRVVLTEVEVQSLVRYRAAGLFPPFIGSPHVELVGGRARIELRVPTERLAPLPDAADIASLLPDTAELTATAQLIPLDTRRMALAVDELSAAGIPLPDGLIPLVLARLGREDEPGLPPDAMPVPLPPGAATAYLRGGTLVFLARPRRTGRE